MPDKYLPIGTIVTLQNQTKPIVIVGFAAISEDKSRIYDYCGYPFPEGFCGNDKNIFFNHELIKEINHLGYETEGQKEFNDSLTKILDEYKQKTQE